MDRRAFIKLTAVTGTSATLASCGNPENQLIRFIPDDELVPGVAEWKPGVCPSCGAGCGLQVRVMEADVDVTRNGQAGVVKMGVAKKLEGNPAHPVNQGALCPRGQAAIQLTYHPDRIAHPLKRTGPRGTGQFQEVSWDVALSELRSRLDGLAAANDQRSLGFLTRPRRSRRQELAAQFLARFGAPPPLTFELFSEDVLRRANALSFGRDQLPTFDLARSRYVLSFGADFLGTWNSPVSQNAGYALMRQGHPGRRGKFVQVESRMSQTGASADEWIPARPGTEGVLALGLAHVILDDRLRPASAAGQAGALIDGWTAGLADYAPELVEKQTGVAASKIKRLAHELAEWQPAVAMIGGAPLAQTNGLFQALAVNALHALVGGVGRPGGVFFTPQMNAAAPQTGAAAAPKRSIGSVAADILSAARPPIQVLLIDDANPVFATPRAWRVREAFEKVPFIASFGSFIDETSSLADLVLPDHSFLESWVDGLPESGAMVAVANLAPPAMRPLHQTRAMPDVLLEVGRRLRHPLDPPLPWETFDAMLQATLAAPPAPRSSADEDPWIAAQKQGGWWGDIQDGSKAVSLKMPPVRFVEPQFDGAAGDYPFHFHPYASPAFLDGSLAHLPWMQELPDPLTSAMWSSWIELNPRTAERLKIAQGDVVEIASQHGSLRAPALLSPGIAPDLIAMPVGQGHETFTRYASGRGANPISILAPVAEAATGSLAWAATRVRLTRVSGDNGQMILFAGEMREHAEGHQR
jgi:menaquinone reductase, molybdopterin-binding-like subunit